MKDKKFKFMLTNAVTFIRVIGIFDLIPVFKIYGGFQTALLSAGCFATDCIDGLMARGFKTSSFFGSFFDATSDKAFLIVNMILLMGITPLAIIPIILELSIATVQTYKYNQHINVKPNKIGKAKMWVAAICVSLCYLLVDQNNINYFGADLVSKMMSLDHIKLFSAVLLPLVLSEIVTLASYIKEFFDEKKKLTPEIIEEKKQEEEKVLEELKDVPVKEILFEHEYYEQYKDYDNLKIVETLVRTRKRKK